MNSNQPQPGSSSYYQPTPPPPPRHSQQQSQSTCFISRCPLFTQSVSPGQVIVLENVTSSTVHLHVDPALQPCNATIFAPVNAPRNLNQVPGCQIINQPIFYVTPFLSSTEPADNVNTALGNNLSTNTQQPPNRKEHQSSGAANATSTESEFSYPASTSSSNIGLEFSCSDSSDSETESVDEVDGGSKESATQTYE